jgi:hypothetical protein
MSTRRTEVLASGDDGFERAAGEQGGSGETAIGCFHANRLADKGRCLQLCVAVNLIALWHWASLRHEPVTDFPIINQRTSNRGT